MRSSIACLRCRKSKIKCDNDGGNSPCDGCIKARKHCQYPESGSTPPKRPEVPAPKHDRESSGPGAGWNQTGHDRKRFKRANETAKSEVDRAPEFAEDALSQAFLTEDLWDSLFDLYKLHFATELPFLHIPTLKEKISDKARLQHSDDKSASVNIVLLGVLALTARFHTDLVRYIGNQVNPGPGSARSRPMNTKLEPFQASDYYANVLYKSLGNLRACMTDFCVERVQAYLMLGLYEWAKSSPETGGKAAWMWVGNAIRMAQGLELGVGDHLEEAESVMEQTRGAIKAESKRSALSTDLVIEKEIQRRTMFSCLIMDRIISCGKNRAFMIQSKDLQIQLPCSEDAFDLSRVVYTGFLDASSAPDPEKPITDDSMLSRFIRLIDIWGEISKFSFSGGRLNEAYPPWDKRTTFSKLLSKLDVFSENLPATFSLSKHNYYRHANHQASSVFVALHMLAAVCRIMLHREYIPYIPVRCEKPCGPLDPPKFPADKFEVPKGFWEDSADQVFACAREIVELIKMCQKRERDNLPQSGLVVFSIWSAAYVSIYAYHFPHMDVENRLFDRFEKENTVDITKDGPTGIAYQALCKLSHFNTIAATYAVDFARIDQYYADVKRDVQSGLRRQDLRGVARRSLSVRHGGPGGGLDEWRRDRDGLTNYGTIMPTAASADPEANDEPAEARIHSVDRGSETETEYVMSASSASPRASASFRPVNIESERTKAPSWHGDGMVPASIYEEHNRGVNATPQPMMQDSLMDLDDDQAAPFRTLVHKGMEGARFGSYEYPVGDFTNLNDGEFLGHWHVSLGDDATALLPSIVVADLNNQFNLRRSGSGESA